MSHSVAVTGATGLVGVPLVNRLEARGDRAIRVVRREARDDSEIRWNPASGEIDGERLEGVDAVVHLAGENIAGARWNDEVKRRIRDSRVEGTTLLANALASRERKPRVLVCASAVGYYGDRGDELLDEESPSGEGFLPEVCREWEAACDPARDAGIRVVNLRIGVVLAREGGALKEMLGPFRWGVGGVVGSGRQFWSWIALDDLVSAILHAVECDTLHGPVNAVAPNSATNREFTKALGRVLRRPTILPLPGFAARLVLGEMANDLLLASVRAVPNRLVESGFEFAHPEIEGAIRYELDAGS